MDDLSAPDESSRGEEDFLCFDLDDFFDSISSVSLLLLLYLLPSFLLLLVLLLS